MKDEHYWILTFAGGDGVDDIDPTAVVALEETGVVLNDPFVEDPLDAMWSGRWRVPCAQRSPRSSVAGSRSAVGCRTAGGASGPSAPKKCPRSSCSAGWRTGSPHPRRSGRGSGRPVGRLRRAGSCSGQSFAGVVGVGTHEPLV